MCVVVECAQDELELEEEEVAENKSPIFVKQKISFLFFRILNLRFANKM